MRTGKRWHRGSSAVSLVAGLVVLALIGGGIFWVIQQGGQAAGRHAQQAGDAQDAGESLAIKIKMGEIHRLLMIMRQSRGSMPGDNREFIDWLVADGAGALIDPDDLSAPNPQDPPVVYVAPSGRGSARDVVVYEHPENHDRLGGHVLRGDGSVQWLGEEAFAAFLESVGSG